MTPAGVQLDSIKRSISTLRYLAESGDIEAMDGIVQVGLDVSDMLFFIQNYTSEIYPINRATRIIAENSLRWPIAVPALEEIRHTTIAEHLPPCLGDAKVIRVKKRAGKGGSRTINNSSQSGLAFNLFCCLEKVLEKRLGEVPELTEETLKSWVEEGLMMVSERPDLFPPNTEITSAIERRILEGGNADDAPAFVWSKKIEAGFRSLIKSSEP